VTPEHSDSGFITILSTFGYNGLQVQIDGEYRDIKPIKDSLIVNIGDILSKISNRRIKATLHRVWDIGVERFSCPFFMEPRADAKIGVGILESERRWCEDQEYDERMK